MCELRLECERVLLKVFFFFFQVRVRVAGADEATNEPWVQESKTTQETFSALKSGAGAMKQIQKETNIDEVDKVMDDINEQSEKMRQVQEALGQPVGYSADLVGPAHVVGNRVGARICVNFERAFWFRTSEVKIVCMHGIWFQILPPPFKVVSNFCVTLQLGRRRARRRAG